MPKRGYYADTIEQKYQPGETGSGLRGTDTQKRAARVLREQWGPDANFQKLEGNSDVSSSTLQRVHDHCFRSITPLESELTWYELENEYDDPDRFFEAKESGDLNQLKDNDDEEPPETGIPLSEREKKIANLFYELGQEDAREAVNE